MMIFARAFSASAKPLPSRRPSGRQRVTSRFSRLTLISSSTERRNQSLSWNPAKPISAINVLRPGHDTATANSSVRLGQLAGRHRAPPPDRWGRSDDNRLYDSCPAHVMTSTHSASLSQEPWLGRECDGLTARKAPGRSGVPRTWLTRVRWAACRVRTAARERPGLTGGRPPRGRPGFVGIHR